MVSPVTRKGEGIATLTKYRDTDCNRVSMLLRHRYWLHGYRSGVPLMTTLYDVSVTLRLMRNNMRILFASDPCRMAILLLGGGKTNDWEGWYRRSIPEAVARYRVYLDELTKESL